MCRLFVCVLTSFSIIDYILLTYQRRLITFVTSKPKKNSTCVVQIPNTDKKMCNL